MSTLDIDRLLKAAGHVPPDFLQNLWCHQGHCQTDVFFEFLSGISQGRVINLSFDKPPKKIVQGGKVRGARRPQQQGVVVGSSSAHSAVFQLVNQIRSHVQGPVRRGAVLLKHKVFLRYDR